MDTEKKALVGHVHSLETFGLVDGPGVRTVVFLQGCRMRCRYCHNPETWSMSGGEEWSAKDLFNRVYRYRTYWKNNGGITVSGGEPLLQIDFLLEFLHWRRQRAFTPHWIPQAIPSPGKSRSSVSSGN